MASVRSLAVGSGAAFTLGSVAGVLGDNLAQGRNYWIGFVAVTVVGAVVSAWLTYRAAAPGVPAASVTHRGSSRVKSVKSTGSGPAVGINYGTTPGAPSTANDSAKTDGTP